MASSAELTRRSVKWREGYGDWDAHQDRGAIAPRCIRFIGMKDRSHDEVMAEIFRTDPLYVAALLREVQRDGCEAELKIFFRQLSRAFSRETARLAPFPIEDATDKS